MYQQIMYDVHRQWLQEFDREAAIRRQGFPGGGAAAGRRSPAPRARVPPDAPGRGTRAAAVARGLAQASQCS